MPPDTNSWHEWRRLVLDKLSAHRDELRALRSEVGQLRTDVATLKVKASAWGAVAGLIPAIGALLWMALNK